MRTHQQEDFGTGARAGADGSLGRVLREIGSSAKDVIHDEIVLLKEEVKDSAARAGRHSVQLALFGSLVALSILPLLAFVVIGLGELWGHRYWLSSLVVGLVCLGAGGYMALKIFRKIKDEDLKLTHSRRGFDREMRSLREKIDDLKAATWPRRRS
jgi:hypothetical protein